MVIRRAKKQNAYVTFKAADLPEMKVMDGQRVIPIFAVMGEESERGALVVAERISTH